MKPEVTVVSTLEDVKHAALHAKFAACPDQTEYFYQKEGDITQESIQDSIQSGCVQYFHKDGEFYSVVCSLNEQTDCYKWHISMCCLRQNSRRKMTDEETSFFLSGYCNEYEEIPTPSQMVEVRHFVGND